MRSAIADADVGDDVFGEDPTVRRLEQHVARLLGKEAALFVPTGVMGNQLAIRAQTSPGDEVVVERTSHIFNYESGAGSALAGIQLNPVDGPAGFMTAAQIRAHIRHGYYWETPTRLICLENTLNKAGGRILDQDEVLSIADVAAERNIPLHLDGARLWNASVATGRAISDLARPFASVSVCLSKGLGAPVGSVVAGSTDFVRKAHRFRKMYGGGMRQVGVLAAAGLYAIENNFERLAEDHANARALAEGLSGFSRVSLNLETVETNIVMFDVTRDTALQVVEALRSSGVLVQPFGPSTIRATTHKDVTRHDVASALGTMENVLN